MRCIDVEPSAEAETLGHRGPLRLERGAVWRGSWLVVSLLLTSPACTRPNPAYGDDDPSGDDSTGPTTATATETTTPTADGSTTDAPCVGDACPVDCSLDTDCEPGWRCCAGGCIDPQSDVDHCGACDSPCDAGNQAVACIDGSCVANGCLPGFYDCDGLGATGCESDAPCDCTPAQMQPCYPGPAGTQGVGVCVAGEQVCLDDGASWGECMGAVVPADEICANLLDEDCNGVPDDVLDVDADGWTVCDGDCCEGGDGCASPELVNPGAYEFVGNGIDDDCDPATSDDAPPPPCSLAAEFVGSTGVQLAQAMDLCRMTAPDAPLPMRRWGLMGAELLTASGAIPVGDIQLAITGPQTAVLTNFGSGGVAPQGQPTMAGLSTGTMRDSNDPGWVGAVGGTSHDHVDAAPAAYLAANGGSVPGSIGCDAAPCPSPSGVLDPVNLRLVIRVPTNVNSLSYKFRFFTGESAGFVCTTFNDYFLALLDSGAAGVPADGNISLDMGAVPMTPASELIEICEPFTCYPCLLGTGPLAGTGMVSGTQWLTTSAPVVPGEIITLDLIVFDAGDHFFDTSVVLDDFEWSSQVLPGPTTAH